jgi:hypothetical protein
MLHKKARSFVANRKKNFLRANMIQKQGDQMSLWKKSPKVKPKQFLGQNSA